MRLRHQLPGHRIGKLVKCLEQNLRSIIIGVGRCLRSIPILFTEKGLQGCQFLGIDIATPAGGIDVLHSGPGVHNPGDDCGAGGGIGFCGELPDKVLQVAARVPRHGLT